MTNINTFQGNVGIGTTEPVVKLHVSGGKAFIGGFDDVLLEAKRDGVGPAVRLGSTDGILEIASISSEYGNETVTMQSYIDQGNSGTYSDSTRNWLVLQPYVGRVGIGKTVPGSTLDVAGTVTATAFSGGNFTGSTGSFTGTGDSIVSVNNTSSPAIIRTLTTASQVYFQSGTAFTSDSRANINFTSMYNATSFLTIKASNGNVGIATTNPLTKLHVNGQNGAMPNGYRRYFAYNTARLDSGEYTDWGNGISIFASSSILTNAFFVSHSGQISASDRRIKTEIQDVDDIECLEVLRHLQPKKYKYKDTTRGDEFVWGFIAQEVRDTIPYATNLRKDAIPNIFEIANVSSSNVITFTHFNTSNLDANTSTIEVITIDQDREKVKISEIIDDHTIRVEEDLSKWTVSIDETGNVITEITTTTLTVEEYEALEVKTGYVANISGYQNANVIISTEEYNDLEDATGYEEIIENYTKTETIYPGTQLFVYGQEVDDFVFLKKEAIFTVATAALQEVDRQQQADKLRIAELETQLASVLSRLEALESA
jgi:hypothetical protein